jgi:NADH-quinone oxidoreductase subunit C
MTNEEIKEFISAAEPSAVFDESGEWLNITVAESSLKKIAGLLNKSPFNFDYLFCLTCVDWKIDFTLVYHLSSTIHRHTIVIKSKVDRSNPEIDTVSDIWKGANFFEREVFDLFGVNFKGHPDMRRLIMPDDWEGWPLRKDYVDEVNMIKL